MFLGFARGKVGSLVFSRSNGQQVTRAKADVVKNPQTQAQMIQRIILNTIAQAYSAMQPICDHSFEGLPKGQASMSYFMRKNMKDLREKVATQLQQGYFMEEIFEFSPLNTDILVPNDYMVSKGTLPKVDVIDANADGVMAFYLPANTYESLINHYGLQRGDQLTFVGLQGASASNLSFEFARVILDPRDSEGVALPLSTAFVAENAIVSPNERNEGRFGSIAFDSDKVTFGFGASYLVAAAVIVSRKGENEVWQRSTAYLKANESSSERTYSLQYCLDNFATGGITTTSSRYLNNAGQGGATAAAPSPDDPVVDTFTATRLTFGEEARNLPLNNTDLGNQAGLTITKVEGDGTLDANYKIKVFKGASQVGNDYTVATNGTVTGDVISLPEDKQTFTAKLYHNGEEVQNLGDFLYGEGGGED